MSSQVKSTYPGSRTAKENSRLRRQHDIVKSLFDEKLILAPLDLRKPGLCILDSGTADGYWLKDISSQVGGDAALYGTDIASQQFLGANELPPNVKLSVQSIKEDWPVEWQGKFDLVHQRGVLANLQSEELPTAMTRYIGLLKGDGWLQFVDGNVADLGQDDKDSSSALTTFQLYLGSLMNHFGLRPSPGLGLEKLLKDAGLVDVHSQESSMMIGKGAPSPELEERGIEEYLGILDANRDAISSECNKLLIMDCVIVLIKCEFCCYRTTRLKARHEGWIHSDFSHV